MSRWNWPGSPCNQARRPHPWRPKLEVLEGRCLPSTVTNLDDAGAGSLRQAILDTPGGGTVDFQPGLSGTITLTTGELLINKDLTIAGPGADVITISGNQASRVFEIAATFTVDISGLTIADGQANPTGAGVLNAGTLSISDAAITGNAVSFPGLGGPGMGGGIYNSGRLTISDSTFRGNSATGGFALNGNPGEGGGLYNAGTAVVTSSTWVGDSASGGSGGSGYNRGLGGGIDNTGTLTLTDATLTGNSAHGLDTADGAGIENAGTLTISSTTLSGNSVTGANGDGGGIFNNDGRVTITNSTLSGNAAVSTGGGFFNPGEGTATITDSTIASNSAANGGGVYSPIGLFTRDTIIAGNTGGLGPDVLGDLGSQGHNLIGDTSGGTGFVPSDLLNMDPLFGPLQDNGGPTLTMALLPGSPAIDAGDNTDAPMWDQRGTGFHRIVNGTIDIGAFEVQYHAHNPPTGHSLPDPVTVQVLGPSGPAPEGSGTLAGREIGFVAVVPVDVPSAEAVPVDSVVLAGGRREPDLFGQADAADLDPMAL